MKVRHKALKRLRVGLGLTQKEVAKCASLSRSCIANIENGYREPKFLTLLVITTALGANTRDFIRKGR